MSRRETFLESARAVNDHALNAIPAARCLAGVEVVGSRLASGAA